MSKISRRSILRSAGTAGLLGSIPLEQAFAQFFQPASRQLYPPNTIVTACGICDSACGIRATVENGVIRFLQGLPEDPHNAGGLCAKGITAAQTKDDPDRLKYPMKRTNPRKGFDQDPGFVRISWNEALDTIAGKFQRILDEHGPSGLLAVSRGRPEILNRLYRSLAITRVDHNDVCYGVDIALLRHMTGPHSFAYDLENSNYIVLFGWDMMARAKLVLAHNLLTACEKGAKVVCFNPALTATARFAGEWHHIRPGSDLAVALAMIHVLLESNLFDREFVTQYTNFPEHEQAIREHFKQYTPDWAEKLSDVPAADIRRIAREFGENRPSVAPIHKKQPAANYANATQTTQAINILNILVGAVDRPGGRYWPRTFSIPALDSIVPPPRYPALPTRRVDGRERIPLAQEGNYGMFSTLAHGMLNDYPGQVKGVFWFGYHLLSFPDALRMGEALKTVDFTVVVDILPVDAMYFADILLPNTMYLEGNDIITRSYVAKDEMAAVARQALTPGPFETRSTPWIALELGKRLAPDFFRKADGGWINMSEVLDEQTKRAGLGENFAEFRQKGIVRQPVAFVPRTTFNTPSGKCQIFVPAFAAMGGEPLPSWTPKRDEPNGEFPYYLITYLPGPHKRNSTQNNRLLHEIMPSNSAQINPALAARLGIREGQLVRVRSRIGSIELPAHLTETIRPDCVMVAHGFGHQSPHLTLAGGMGASDNLLIPAQSVETILANRNFTGSGAIMDAVVTLEPVSG
jgi:thiosulfate reductase/polysulfide reductase chain A